MSKPNPTKKQKKEIVSPVFKILSFLATNLPDFWEFFPYDKTNTNSMGEDELTEALVFFLTNKSRAEDFSFMPQAIQKGRRTVDIGVFLFGNRLSYIFCIEAKFLPHSPFDYITGEYAAIKRFKAMQHGVNNSIDNIPLPQNGIIAYVKSGTFEKHFIKINEEIRKIANKHSQKPDDFGLTWNISEQLKKIYFKSIAKLFSIHPRQKASNLELYHFWVYIPQISSTAKTHKNAQKNQSRVEPN
ncbi:MAG: hypothetical protein GY797_28230 [Deltaproteobacteria bacterium]|nr:hypothetical protein [Deltaproteobacteria bacterium]